jgi:hypothetical protein
VSSYLATLLRDIAPRATNDLCEVWMRTRDSDKFGVDLFELLTKYHTVAVYEGRKRAGDRTPPEDDDRRFAETVMRSEDPFIAEFQADLDAGKYDDRGVQPIMRRAQYYLKRVMGTANEAWALTTPGGIWWVMGGAEDHCPDCPRLAAQSPYTALTLPTYPRACETQCLFNCKCFLRAEDGSHSFPYSPA